MRLYRVTSSSSPPTFSPMGASTSDAPPQTVAQPKTCRTLARVPWVTERASPAPTKSRPTTRDTGDLRLVRAGRTPKAMPTLRPPRRPSRDGWSLLQLDAAVSPAGPNQGSPHQCLQTPDATCSYRIADTSLSFTATFCVCTFSRSCGRLWTSLATPRQSLPFESGARHRISLLVARNLHLPAGHNGRCDVRPPARRSSRFV